jgi:hypothetical protein
MANLTNKSTNEEILAVYQKDIDAGKCVVFALEQPANKDKPNNWDVYAEEGPIGLVARTGAKTRLVRAVANLPKSSAYCKVGVQNLHIVVSRVAGDYSIGCTAVLNPTTDEIITRNGEPVFEKREIHAKAGNPAMNLTVEGTQGTITKQEAYQFLMDNFSIEARYAANAVQLPAVAIPATV